MADDIETLVGELRGHLDALVNSIAEFRDDFRQHVADDKLMAQQIAEIAATQDAGKAVSEHTQLAQQHTLAVIGTFIGLAGGITGALLGHFLH